MQDIDIRYAFIIFPVVYALIPFVFSADFTDLVITSASAFLGSAALLLILTSLNIVGSGMNQEGTYQAFVLTFGGMFYFVTVLFNLLNGNLITKGVGFFLLRALGIVHKSGVSVSNATASGTLSPSSIYPSSFIISVNGLNLPIFPLVDGMFGIMYVMGLYFLISSRGH